MPHFQGQTARFRYTSDTVLDTFPWPQKPGAKQIRAVADAAREVRALRRQIMDANGWSLRDPRAHLSFLQPASDGGASV